MTDNTSMTQADLAGLVGSRLCHDLVSPLGAIGNGIELLSLSPGMAAVTASPEMALINDALAAARARINLFRLAFGQSGGDQRIGQAELARSFDEMAAGGRLKITLDAQGDVARVEMRMLLLAALCVETSLPWGGTLTVVRQAPAGWRLVAEAARTRPDTRLWAWLNGGEAAPATPAQVQFPLLAALAAQTGRDLHGEIDEQGAEIRF